MKLIISSCIAMALGLAIGIAPGMMKPERNLAERGPDTTFVHFNPQLLDQFTGASYDAVVRVKEAGKSSDSALRLFTDAIDDQNYIALEADGSRLRVLVVEAGIMRVSDNVELKGIPLEIQLKRRTPLLELVCDGKTVIRTAVSGFGDGRFGTGATGGIVLGKPLVQPVGAVMFEDNFMRGPEETGGWQRGGKATWEVRSLDNPGRSSNAFVYQGWGNAGGVSLVGNDYWDSYRVEVSVQGPANGMVGLVVAASKPVGKARPEYYCLLRWSAVSLTPEEKGKGRMELIQVVKGKPTVLASKPGGYEPGQWYRLSATSVAGRVTFSIDGHEMLTADSPFFSGGRAGLYVKSEKPAEFDDFRLFSLEDLPTGNLRQIDWQFYGGEWKGATNRMEALLTGPFPAIAVAGIPRWENITVTAEMKNINEQHGYGLVMAFQDPANYIAYRVNPYAKTTELIRVNAGKETVLANGSQSEAAEETSISLSVDRGYICAGALHAFVSERLSGRVGMMTFGTKAPVQSPMPPIEFKRFEITPVMPPKQVVSINEVFDDEQMMAIWSGVAGDWRGGRIKGSSTPYDTAYWHRGMFFDDAEIESVLPKKLEHSWRLALSLAKPLRAKGSDNGYVLSLEAKKEECDLKLIRQGEEKAAVKLQKPPLRLRFRKAGPILIGYADDKPILTWLDPAPVNGPKIAWASRRLAVKPETVQIYSRSLRDYSFNDAPVDWRRAGGVWQVTNRWECDPRWSFMAGMPPYLARSRMENLTNRLTPQAKWKIRSLQDQLGLLSDEKSLLAALWHKNEFSGDMVVECFLGQMMDSKRGGGKYQKYVKNFCLTVCGDGRDFSRGYTCIFGGWGNTKSVIMRDGKIVSDSTRVIPVRSSIHRKWFRLRVERRGPVIIFTAHTQHSRRSPETELLRMVYEDKEPLIGKRVGVWTYDNGILLTRMRIAAAKVGEAEGPMFSYPAVSPSPYDDKNTDTPRAEKVAK